MCEQGLMHEDMVKFYQVNRAEIEGVNHQQRQPVWMWISLDSYIKAGLNTIRCEKGLEQVEEVNFDQIK